MSLTADSSGTTLPPTSCRMFNGSSVTNDMNNNNIEARMAGGYLLWTACGAGIRFSKELRVPWLITSAVNDSQYDALTRAVAAFSKERDVEHSVSRDALEDFRKRRKDTAGFGFQDPLDKAEEARLKEEAQMTCQPLLMDICPGYDRLVQAVQFSRYCSCGIIDRGPGRAAFITWGHANARKRLAMDPVLRMMQSPICTTMVRSSNGGAVTYKSFDRAAFFNATLVYDTDEVLDNLDGMDSLIRGSAVVLPGQGDDRYDASQFRMLLDRVHTCGREPHDFTFAPEWDEWFTSVPNVCEYAMAAKKIELMQGVTAWNSLKGLVVGVLASERMLACDGHPSPDDLVFAADALPEAASLLSQLARIVYGVIQADRLSCSRATGISAARDALAAKRQQSVADNVHNWFIEVQKVLLKKGSVGYCTLTRGNDKVLTAGQLDAVLEEYPMDIVNAEQGVRLLRDPVPAYDPEVAATAQALADAVRDNVKSGGKPWIPRSAIPPGCEVMWKDIVRHCQTTLLTFSVAGERMVTVLKDREGWLSPWRHHGVVVAAARELNLKYQDDA